MTTWTNLGLQDSASPLMEQLNMFHDNALFIVLLVTAAVGYIMSLFLFNKLIDRHFMHGQSMEVIWTILPAIVLIFIALPSLRILYLLDEVSQPTLTLKTIGHQWYWSYEYSDFKSIEFDSYLIPSNDLNNNGFRLLDVDNRLIIPLNSQIRMLVAAADVLHSWTIPSLGVKIDATPGRLNQSTFMVNRIGLFFGQCSEICGANHSFMPIVIESIPIHLFMKWIMNYNMND